MDIQMLYEDKYYLIVNKPNNIAVQKTKQGVDGLLEILQKQYKELHLINRLDTNVGGVVVLGKTADAVTKFNNTGTVDKYYTAIISGVLDKNKGELENWLMKNQRLNISKVVNPNSSNSKIARLKYEVIRIVEIDNKKYTVVQIQLGTGRHHQIRVQFSHIGHPIYGDKKYNAQFKRSREVIGLCASKIVFVHPYTNKNIEVNAEFMHDTIMAKVIEK